MLFFALTSIAPFMSTFGHPSSLTIPPSPQRTDCPLRRPSRLAKTGKSAARRPGQNPYVSKPQMPERCPFPRLKNRLSPSLPNVPLVVNKGYSVSERGKFHGEFGGFCMDIGYRLPPLRRRSRFFKISGPSSWEPATMPLERTLPLKKPAVSRADPLLARAQQAAGAPSDSPALARAVVRAHHAALGARPTRTCASPPGSSGAGWAGARKAHALREQGAGTARAGASG
jgi:hypothetical protein